MKKEEVVILGSTGSVGTSTVQVIEKHKDRRFRVGLLAACSNVQKIAGQAKKLGAASVYLDNPSAREDLAHLKSMKTRRVLESRSELIHFLGAGSFDIAVVTFADFEMSTLVLRALLERRDRALKVLVASKEPIVVFGDYFKELAVSHGHHLIPLDSEPSAIYQCLGGSLSANGDVEKIYLTATGGPFYKNPVAYDRVTPAMALNHPIWNMGKKITVDSATLVNKALELMEIGHLFSLSTGAVKILIHPQCVVHSMVAMRNGSILAQMGPATMKLPIHYGLLWPRGFSENGVLKPIDARAFSHLTFEEPDLKRFPALKFALEIAGIADQRKRLIARSAFLGADEAAVENFVSKRLSFAKIPTVLKETVRKAQKHFMGQGPRARAQDLEFGLQVYRWAKEKASARGG
ncbi:MAG: hypothetical protein HY401_06370 [Elusimicrobia bacterium]|nr:hypothetical protein [Elusimicrobiota bacterium]